MLFLAIIMLLLFYYSVFKFQTIADKISYRNVARFQAALSMKIDSLEQRPSINTGLETLPETNEDSLTPESTGT